MSQRRENCRKSRFLVFSPSCSGFLQRCWWNKWGTDNTTTFSGKFPIYMDLFLLPFYPFPGSWAPEKCPRGRRTAGKAVFPCFYRFFQGVTALPIKWVGNCHHHCISRKFSIHIDLLLFPSTRFRNLTHLKNVPKAGKLPEKQFSRVSTEFLLVSIALPME